MRRIVATPVSTKTSVGDSSQVRTSQGPRSPPSLPSTEPAPLVKSRETRHDLPRSKPAIPGRPRAPSGQDTRESRAAYEAYQAYRSSQPHPASTPLDPRRHQGADTAGARASSPLKLLHAQAQCPTLEMGGPRGGRPALAGHHRPTRAARGGHVGGSLGSRPRPPKRHPRKHARVGGSR